MAADEQSRLLEKSSDRWRIISAAFIALAIGISSVYILSQYRSNIGTHPLKSHKAAPVRVAITALGHLEPQGEVTVLSAPSSLSDNRLEKLLLKEGSRVRVGQIVALLQDYSKATAALQQAQDKVKVAKARLAQVKAKAKSTDIEAQKAVVTGLETQLKGEISTQQAAIVRLQAQLDNAQTENSRYKQLYIEGAISASIADSKYLELQIVQQQLTEARANLNKTISTLNDQSKEAKARLRSLSEVRDVDIQVVQGELESAITAITQAKVERDLTCVTSPLNGTILKVHAKAGETIGNSGIVEIGETSQMYVVAEVYQTNIKKVRIGQKATITSTAFTKKLSGTVSSIGLQVSKQSILSVNPGIDTDHRVIEVKIRINNSTDSQQVAGLTNLQVDVAIQI
ncbi:MAG TPA: ABC exporter membrane fusion protein [Nostoc sp.]|uniref:ABC exporter membrane fusion protein n=1 Tax=Nostoc sp. TaxID=1180 RepID=UPI002D2C50F4|nr:ABC exporter membrane fusion protein [Nostoc sp.]HYX18246.1 ABC exporter membrane fusion protein [Nostoc sp.]